MLVIGELAGEELFELRSSSSGMEAGKFRPLPPPLSNAAPGKPVVLSEYSGNLRSPPRAGADDGGSLTTTGGPPSAAAYEAPCPKELTEYERYSGLVACVREPPPATGGLSDSLMRLLSLLL